MIFSIMLIAPWLPPLHPPSTTLCGYAFHFIITSTCSPSIFPTPPTYWPLTLTFPGNSSEDLFIHQNLNPTTLALAPIHYMSLLHAWVLCSVLKFIYSANCIIIYIIKYYLGLRRHVCNQDHSLVFTHKLLMSYLFQYFHLRRPHLS